MTAPPPGRRFPPGNPGQGATMAEDQVTKRDLELLSAGAHTAESFGRTIVSATLAAAAN